MSGFIKTLISSVSGFGFSKIFSAKGALGGDYKDRQFFQHSGFSSIPREGAQALVLKRGENYICVATADNPNDVPNLQNAGDVAIYASSDYIVKISASGEIEIIGNGSAGSIGLGNGSLKNLVDERIVTILESATMPVSGATAGPYVVGTFSNVTTSEVKAS